MSFAATNEIEKTPKPRPPVTKKRSPSWVPNNDRVLPAQPQTPRRTTADEKGSPSKRKKRPTPLIMTPKASSRANIEYEDIERLRIVDPRADPRMDNAHHTVRNLSPEQTEFLDRIDPRLKMTNGTCGNATATLSRFYYLVVKNFFLPKAGNLYRLFLFSKYKGGRLSYFTP